MLRNVCSCRVVTMLSNVTSVTYLCLPRTSRRFSQITSTTMCQSVAVCNGFFKPQENLALPIVNPIRHYASKSNKKESRPRKGGKHSTTLNDEEASEVINVESLKEKLERTVNKLREDYGQTLSIRTSVGSLEKLDVKIEDDSQKGSFPLHEIAQVVRKNPNLVLINCAALPTAIPAVLESIRKSGMNLNPQQEGTTIYVPLPQVTREHRENLARNAKGLYIRARDELRETQSRFIKVAMRKTEGTSEDLIYGVQQYITHMTDDHITQAENLLKKKQTELLGEAK